MPFDSVFIVIVTYNGISWLERCLYSCQMYNVIVVDNNSTDETVSFIKANFTNVHLLEERQNLGFGKANNLGIKYAINQGAKYVYLLNQDAYLFPDTITTLISEAVKNKNLGILSPIHLNSTENKLDKGFQRCLNWNKEFVFDSLTNNLQSVYEVPFVNAAGWLLPTQTLKTIGGFDPLFFHYGEDENYCQRVRYHKLKIGISTKCFMIHDREFRNNILNFRQELNHKINIHKCNLADVNKEEAINNVLFSEFLLIIKSVIKLKTKNIRLHLFTFKKILFDKSAIQKSRKINKTKGLHYLNL